jgi:hypothetical protein
MTAPVDISTGREVAAADVLGASRGVVVLVDVYAPTMRLARQFLQRGYACVRVQSTRRPPPLYPNGFSSPEFLADITHEGDLAATAALLAPYRPICLGCCGEVGVEFADELADALGLPCNDPAQSALRRNKFRQIDAVRAAGLHTTEHLLVESAAQLSAWHAACDGWIVVKPVRSAGNDGVSFCRTPEESVAALAALADRISILGGRDEDVVAERFLDGPEYILNAVSCRGRHRATDAWRYHKITVNGVRERINGASSLAPDDPVFDELADYGTEVLDCLGIEYGPSHLEIILTDDGPSLVEVGARLCGADTAYYAELAFGESQVTWTVDALADPDSFLRTYRRPRRSLAAVSMAFLQSPYAGRLKRYRGLPAVEQLESFHRADLNVHPGEMLRRTVDDVSEPLMVGLVHRSRAVVERDLSTVTYLDGGAFYELDETTA